jgi:hypothetical protein
LPELLFDRHLELNDVERVRGSPLGSIREEIRYCGIRIRVRTLLSRKMLEGPVNCNGLLKMYCAGGEPSPCEKLTVLSLASRGGKPVSNETQGPHPRLLKPTPA